MGRKRPILISASVWVLAVLCCQLTVLPVTLSRELRARPPLISYDVNGLSHKHLRALRESKWEVMTQLPFLDLESRDKIDTQRFGSSDYGSQNAAAAPASTPSSSPSETPTPSPEPSPSPTPAPEPSPSPTPAQEPSPSPAPEPSSSVAPATVTEPTPVYSPSPIPSPLPWFTPGEVPKAPSPSPEVTVAQAPSSSPNNCIKKTQPFRVLALGDSITEGAIPSKKYSYPYSVKLRELLTQSLGFEPEIKNAGNPGSGVLVQGFSSGGTLLDTSAVYLEEGPYNVVSVAVGINDLLRGGYTADQIMGPLAGLYEKILGKGYPVLAIPPLPAPKFVARDDPKEGQRQLLAERITDYVNNYNGKKDPSAPPMFILNVQATVMNFWNMDTAQNDRYLDDGLHLTEQGYDRLGILVHYRISQNFCK